MMRSIAIGLAAATIAVGGSTLSASALHGQKSGISKGNVSGAIKTRAYGYEEERGRSRITEHELSQLDRVGRLTPREREHVRRIVREGFAELAPREREYLRGAVRERIAGLGPREREHLRMVVRGRMAELTPRERAHVRAMIRAHLAGLSSRERADLMMIERERLSRHGPYGRR